MPSRLADLRILTCEAARPLASRVAAELGVELLSSKEQWFACGEGKLEILSKVRGDEVYVFQSPVTPGSKQSPYAQFVMMLHACEAAALADAAKITAVLPYFPGARQDKRKRDTREGISAGLFARCLQAAGVNSVLTVEIHNQAIAGMFHPAQCHLENLSLHHEVSRWLRARQINADIVASPDVGGLERARAYAHCLGTSLAVLSKVRDYDHPNRIVESTLIGDVDGRDVLLVDDIVDTAGSVVAAIAQLKAGGARDVTVLCSHPLFSSPAWQRLEGMALAAANEGWTFRVVGTTSVEHQDTPPWYDAYDLAPLLARVLGGMHGHSSVKDAQRPPEV